jgi:hypothetical protein
VLVLRKITKKFGMTQNINIGLYVILIIVRHEIIDIINGLCLFSFCVVSLKLLINVIHVYNG